MVVVEALTKGRTAVLLGLGLAVYEGGGGPTIPALWSSIFGVTAYIGFRVWGILGFRAV